MQSKRLPAYRGYQASYTWSAEDRVFHGRLAGVTDIISFEADGEERINAAFHEAVDDCLDWHNRR